MNFGESLIQWVKLFYTDINSLIINNGFFSNSFNIERGVRQGCPLSSSLFIICIEYLSHHIQSNKHIKGISLEPDEEIKQSLFADDATYFLNDNYDSFHNLIESLTLYGMTSGLKLNKSKCTVLRVGKLKQSNVQYKKEMKFNWTSDEATTLGITFTNNEKDTVLKNILPKLQNFKNCLKSWHHRKLTLIGKNTVLKTFALPKLIYVLTVLPNPPNDVINDIKSAIFNFIWDGKPDKIKRTPTNTTP